jgi:predicted patatin/cPLA2 family phospholipase
VSTVDANTGNYDSFTEVETSIDEIAYSVVASASIPVLFPPSKHFKGKVYVDGGTGYGVDLVNAVARCREIVDDDSKIILDVILCFD